METISDIALYVFIYAPILALAACIEFLFFGSLPHSAKIIAGACGAWALALAALIFTL